MQGSVLPKQRVDRQTGQAEKTAQGEGLVEGGGVPIHAVPRRACQQTVGADREGVRKLGRPGRVARAGAEPLVRPACAQGGGAPAGRKERVVQAVVLQRDVEAAGIRVAADDGL